MNKGIAGSAAKVAVLLSLVASLLPGCGPSAETLSYDEATALHPQFSGANALRLAEAVTDFGPRPPGTVELEESRRWIEATLRDVGWIVQRQAFVDPTPQGEIEFVNLRARFAGIGAEVEKADASKLWENPRRVLLASHYDTKFYEGVEFVGANDPGSSIACLLEMARVLATRPEVAKTCELVFFDGEECYVSYTPEDGLFGSRYYARQYRKWPEKLRFEHGILLDLVGDRDLNIRIPRNSPGYLAVKLFAAAEELGTKKYFGSSSKEITDDHVPLNGVGLPTIDVIDLDYAYWHTSADTVDKLSADSMEVVGQAVMLMLEKYLLAAP